MLKQIVLSASLILALTAVPVAAQQKRQTVEEQIALQGLPVYTSDGRQIGQVKQIRIASDGHVDAVRAELPDAAGSEAKTIEIPAAQFTQKSDRVVLSMTVDE